MRTTTALALAALCLPGAALADPDVRSLATGVCAACHGTDGHSISPVFPRLAGQQPAYIVLQLDAFRGHLRGDPLAQAYMWGMASQLSDDTIKGLADYYASLPPAVEPPGPPALMAAGQKIYEEGIPAQEVPACATCHGAKAEGQAAFPRLAGQHVDYLVAQLNGFRTGLRTNAPIMVNVAKTMTPDQVRAVATWAASRKP
jgi:cytochrome c553